MVPPSTQVTCLGVLIDTVKGTISIPPDKLCDVTSTVRQWLLRDVASKHELQSILGLLLYVHKCIKPALDLLRFAHSHQKVTLTPDFKRDFKWFAKFLPEYNGLSLYDHRPIDVTLELDACLTGLGGGGSFRKFYLPSSHSHGLQELDHCPSGNGEYTLGSKALQSPMGVQNC